MVEQGRKQSLQTLSAFDYCLLGFVCVFAAGAFLLILRLGRCLKCEQTSEAEL